MNSAIALHETNVREVLTCCLGTLTRTKVLGTWRVVRQPDGQLSD